MLGINLGASCGGGMVQGVEYDEKGCFVRALELDPKLPLLGIISVLYVVAAWCRGLSTTRRGAS